MLPQIGDQPFKVARIEQRVDIREGAFADGVDGQVLIDAGQLAGIFDASQRTEHGIEERHEIDGDDIVIEQDAIVMNINGAKAMQIALDQLQISLSGDLFGPDLLSFLSPAAKNGSIRRRSWALLSDEPIRTWKRQKRNTESCYN